MSDMLVNIRMADNPRVNEALKLRFKEVAKVTDKFQHESRLSLCSCSF